MILRCTRGTAQEYTDLDTGKSYFSVSQVLTVLDPDAFAGVDPLVLAAAQDRGRNLHILFALTVLARAGVCAMPERPAGVLGKYYDGIEKFVRERKPDPFKVEASSINDQLGYAGTLDYDGQIDGDRDEWIIDLKTGLHRPVHSAQLHAYKRLKGNEKAKRVGSLYITKTGQYKLIEHTHDHVDWAAFQAALSVLHWRRMKG